MRITLSNAIVNRFLIEQHEPVELPGIDDFCKFRITGFVRPKNGVIDKVYIDETSTRLTIKSLNIEVSLGTVCHYSVRHTNELYLRLCNAVENWIRENVTINALKECVKNDREEIEATLERDIQIARNGYEAGVERYKLLMKELTNEQESSETLPGRSD